MISLLDPVLSLGSLADPLRGLAFLILISVWVLSFVSTTGDGGWPIRRFRPRSEHWRITLGLTGTPILGASLAFWAQAPWQALLWGLVLVLVGAELVTRCRKVDGRTVDLSSEQSLYTSRLYQPHHYTLFEPRPNVRSLSGLAHNDMGFRDHRSFGHDPHAIRLVFTGGPTVYGATIQDNDHLFTRLLENLLNNAFRMERGQRHFEVINAGMANATSAEMLLRQIFAVSEVSPALVVVQAGICDTWPRIASDEYHSDFRQMRKRYGHGRWLTPGLSIADSIARALIWRSAVLTRLLGDRVPAEPLLELTNHNNTGRRDRLTRNPPRFFERNLRYLLAINREMGAMSMLVGDPVPVTDPLRQSSSYSLAVSEHSAVMARIAADLGLPFVDLSIRMPLRDEIRERDKYLNAAGQRELAGLMFDELLASGYIDLLLSPERA